MTAEIVLLNQQAVAVAADSAVTIDRPPSEQNPGGKKVFLSANKIFSLSRVHPIGIMVYHTSTLMSVPWEVVIKEYRSQLGKRSMDTVQEYSRDFFCYLEHQDFIPSGVQETAFEKSINGLCSYVRYKIREEARQRINQSRRISLTETRRIVSRIISFQNRLWRDAEYLPSGTLHLVDKTRSRHGEYIRQAISDAFGSLPLTRAQVQKMIDVCCLSSAKLPQAMTPPRHSGVVFVGFGDKEVFPSLHAFITGDMYENVLHYRRDPPNCLEIDFATIGAMVPLAQKDVVEKFVMGMDPRLAQLIDKILRQLSYKLPRQVIDGLNDVSASRKDQLKDGWHNRSQTLEKNLKSEIMQYRRNTFMQPVIRTISSMPKDELAATAEALVSLTSVSRKVATEMETVGGPIDVAVISKGDGFVWIHRKHYFRSELNPQFLSRSVWEVEHAEED